MLRIHRAFQSDLKERAYATFADVYRRKPTPFESWLIDRTVGKFVWDKEYNCVLAFRLEISLFNGRCVRNPDKVLWRMVSAGVLPLERIMAHSLDGVYTVWMPKVSRKDLLLEKVC